MAYTNVFILFDSLEIDLCDLINEDAILAIRTPDEIFPYYIMKSTTCVVQLRKSLKASWSAIASPR